MPTENVNADDCNKAGETMRANSLSVDVGGGRWSLVHRLWSTNMTLFSLTQRWLCLEGCHLIHLFLSHSFNKPQLSSFNPFTYPCLHFFQSHLISVSMFWQLIKQISKQTENINERGEIHDRAIYTQWKAWTQFRYITQAVAVVPLRYYLKYFRAKVKDVSTAPHPPTNQVP